MLLALVVAAGAGHGATPGHAQEAAAPYSLHASFTGSAYRSTCTTTTCRVSSTSTVCQDVALDPGIGFPTAGVCHASISGSVPGQVVTTPAGKRTVCGPTGTATFTFNNGHGLSVTMRATLTLHNGWAKFNTPDLITIGGAVYVGHGKGVIVAPCGADTGETAKVPFAGTFEYVRV